jgi:alpha-glucosidase
MAVAEITCERQLERVIEYTAGATLLHTAYSFALLGPPRDAASIRAIVAGVLDAPGEPWPSWALSNHDVPRVASRWAAPAEPPAAVAPLFLALLLMLRGTIFLYQGEELGLPQAHIPRDALRDPEAINNYPFGQGRDGARTPMPWDDTPGAGFTTATPWLPSDPAHRALSVASQEHDPASPLALTRRLLALRRSLPGFGTCAIEWIETVPQLLAFDRVGPGWRLRCVFNLAADQTVALPAEIASVRDSAGLTGAQLAPRGFVIGAAF